MEREPVDFLVRKMTPLVDESRDALARLIGADPADVVFVQNATAGVNSVMRSLDFRPGDEILVTAHDYNACRNVIRYVAQRTGAVVVEADVPLPIDSPRQVVDAVLERVTAADAAGHARSHHQPYGAGLSDRGNRARVGPARHRHAGRRRPRAGHGSVGHAIASGRPITRAIATSGSVPRRPWAFCTCGATGSRASSRRSSATAGTSRGRAIRPSRTPSTGPARSIRRPGCASARHSLPRAG